MNLVSQISKTDAAAWTWLGYSVLALQDAKMIVQFIEGRRACSNERHTCSYVPNTSTAGSVYGGQGSCSATSTGYSAGQAGPQCYKYWVQCWTGVTAVLQVLGTVLDSRDRSATSTVLDMFHNYITNL